MNPIFEKETNQTALPASESMYATNDKLQKNVRKANRREGVGTAPRYLSFVVRSSAFPRG